MDEEFFDIGRLLLRAAREFSARVCQGLRARSHPDLKAGHALVISVLDTSGTRLSVLAERAGVSKQAMGQLVKELEVLGYLCRDADAADARAVRMMPTERGHALLRDVAELVVSLEARQIRKIGREELGDLRRTLLLWVETDEIPDEPDV